MLSYNTPWRCRITFLVMQYSLGSHEDKKKERDSGWAENHNQADQPRQRNGQTLLADLKTVQTACRKSVEITARDSGKMPSWVGGKASRAELCGSQRDAGKGPAPPTLNQPKPLTHPPELLPPNATRTLYVFFWRPWRWSSGISG